MDAEYSPINKTTTKIPNLGNSSGDINTQSMHPKYNTMHESCTIEEMAVMLPLDAMSITSLTMYPVIGKYCSVFNNAGRIDAFASSEDISINVWSNTNLY